MTDYSRAYQKGYVAGKRLSDARVKRAQEEVNEANAIADAARRESGVGRCKDCAAWLAGGGLPDPHRYHWGTCREADGVAKERPWFGAMDERRKAVEVTTNKDFGCILFRRSA